MGEFVFPETIRRIGNWDEEGGGKEKEKEQKKENTRKVPRKTNENMTLLKKISHNNLSFELSISQVLDTYIKDWERKEIISLN